MDDTHKSRSVVKCSRRSLCSAHRPVSTCRLHFTLARTLRTKRVETDRSLVSWQCVPHRNGSAMWRVTHTPCELLHACASSAGSCGKRAEVCPALLWNPTGEQMAVSMATCALFKSATVSAFSAASASRKVIAFTTSAIRDFLRQFWDVRLHIVNVRRSFGHDLKLPRSCLKVRSRLSITPALTLVFPPAFAITLDVGKVHLDVRAAIFVAIELQCPALFEIRARHVVLH